MRSHITNLYKLFHLFVSAVLLFQSLTQALAVHAQSLSTSQYSPPPRK